MAKVYKNFIQMKLDLEVKLGVALDNTMERLLLQLQNIIDEVVYGWESPSDNPWAVNRTGQFLESWQKTKPILMGSFIESEISQAIEVMTQFMIGNVEVHGDRDNLADIIISGDGYGLGECYEERDFWSPFQLYCLENLDRIFYEECLKVGLPMQKAVGEFL